MKHKKTLTPEQIKAIETMSAVRLPSEMMAASLGVSKDTFERMIKSNAALRAAIEQGRASASNNVRKLAYAMCFDKKVPDNVRMQAVRFWCGTQEGFTSKLELTGTGGGPIEVNMSNDEANLRLEKLLKRTSKR